MPGSDFWIVVNWWIVLFLFGAAGFPLSKRLFSGWNDCGYFFSKAVALAVVTWIVYVLGTAKLIPFSVVSISLALVGVFLGGIAILFFDRGDHKKLRIRTIFLEELFFFAALVFWSWVKAHEPSIRGLEKFMDYGFMKSILESTYFPPSDMWYAGSPINYYYFGHMVVAVLTKLSGLDLAYTFNLMLSTIFALTITMSFSIGYQIVWQSQIPLRGRQIWQKVVSGALTAFLVTLAGNMQTLYAFTRGYTGENVKPFWELLWGIPLRQGFAGQVGEIWSNLLQGMNTYWYANATRFIPFTIHEFPSYSFVVSDIHGHVLSLPFALLAIGLLLQGVALKSFQGHPLIVFYGFLVGVLLMTNALDGPIYFGLLIAILVVKNWSNLSNLSNWKETAKTVGLIVVVAGFASLPFLSHFKSFVNGIAVNCPPEFLANTKVGPLLFEGVEKCQHSPIWMMAFLWGFFIYCGVWLFLKNKITQTEKILLVFFGFSILLIIFPEFFYFKDIYPAHFRSNTMFKLGYQAFILFSIISGYTIVNLFKKKLFLLLLVPQLFLVSIYPIFSVRSYFNSLKNYEGLDGLAWFAREYADDYKAMQWFNSSPTTSATSPGLRGATSAALPALVEADGDSYTDYNRFSAFTGNPTIVGWAVHEWLWRGGYEFVSPRREEVRLVYESGDPGQIRAIINKYNVRYIIVGTLERQKFSVLDEAAISQIATPVFRSGETVIYEVH